MAIKVLVTGGAGYIGSHAVKALARAGFHPITLDDGSTGHLELIHWGEVLRADLATSTDLVSILRNYKVQAVMHFAARSLVAESHEEPDLYHRVNVLGTLNLLDAMARAGVKALVYSSSAAVYGIPPKTPIPEETSCRPVSPYGETKLAAERSISSYERRHGLRSMSLRYFNAAGADPEADVGEWHNPETHLIPRLVASAVNGVAPVEIYGTDYPTADGACVRDYVHVCDLIDAHLAALNALLKDEAGGIFNLGTGQGFSVKEVIETAQRMWPTAKIKVSEKARRPGDPPILVADASRFARRFNWRPRRSDLCTILETAKRWTEKMGRMNVSVARIPSQPCDEPR